MTRRWRNGCAVRSRCTAWAAHWVLEQHLDWAVPSLEAALLEPEHDTSGEAQRSDTNAAKLRSTR